VALVAFSSALVGGFQQWDDVVLLVDNPGFRGLSWSHLRWMFTADLMGHYMPLSWLSYGLDYVIWGLRPFGYHLTSIGLHVANVALVYLVARRFFHLSREWAAPLASGVSICGVSAAMATAAAIRARPIVPITVSSLVVVFAVVELLLLPAVAATFLHSQPLVAGAWMGLAVKTDGAAVASGAITDALIRARAAAAGITYEEGWILLTATTVKVFIDMFIGIWAFVLALVWAYGVERDPGRRPGAGEVWARFPKFVLGYFLTFLLLLVAIVARPGLLGAAKVATAELNVFRVVFFVMTFFTIGLVSDFRRLGEAGIGRLAAVYVVCLFGFILWIGLGVSWIFFHGILPPRAG